MAIRKTIQKSASREYRAPALEKGLEILEYLADAKWALSRTEIAQGLGRAPSELFRMLACLEEKGYVLRDTESGKFGLSLRLYELGNRANPVQLLRKAARQPMEQLAEQIGQSCHLSVRHGDQLLVLMEQLPARRVCLAVGVGATFPLSRTNSGKLILSGMEPEERAGLIARDPWLSSLSARARATYLKELAAIAAAGQVVAPSNLTEGVRDHAMPVGIEGTETHAILAVSRVLTQDTPTDCMAALQKTAEFINRRLGGAPRQLQDFQPPG